MTGRFSRRAFIRTTAASTGIALLAGCSGSANSGGEPNGESGEGGDSDGDNPSFDGWFSRTGNYDGVHDQTGEESVTVAVGAEGNGAGFAFDPAAVKVSPGTTVVWEWTGNGGTHNVQERKGVFQSELSAQAGFTFEYTFEDAGEYKYVCVPHETLGMVGIVVVE